MRPLAWNNSSCVATCSCSLFMAIWCVDVTSLHEGTGTVIYDKPSSAYVVVTASASLMSHSCFMPPAKILSGQLLRYYINAVFFRFACVRRLARCPTCRSQEGWGRCKVLETLSSSLQSLGILPFTPTSPPSPLLVNKAGQS